MTNLAKLMIAHTLYHRAKKAYRIAGSGQRLQAFKALKMAMNDLLQAELKNATP